MFPSKHNPYVSSCITGYNVCIQNDDIMTFGDNNAHSDGSTSSLGSFPRKIPFSWSNLDGDIAMKHKPLINQPLLI